MASRIKRLTIIAKHGVEQYHIGQEYNGLLLDRIRDMSVESNHNHTSIYDGITSKNEMVFEVINAPIEVSYEAVISTDLE